MPGIPGYSISVDQQYHADFMRLDLMTAQLEWLIKWPDREELWKTMPNSLWNQGGCHCRLLQNKN